MQHCTYHTIKLHLCNYLCMSARAINCYFQGHVRICNQCICPITCVMIVQIKYVYIYLVHEFAWIGDCASGPLLAFSLRMRNALQIPEHFD